MLSTAQGITRVLRWITLCFIALIVGIVGNIVLRNYLERRELRLQGERAAEALLRAQEKQYNIDDTIRAMNNLDRMIASRDIGFVEFLELSARRRATGIAPEIAQQRAKLIRQMTSLYAEISAEEDRKELYDDYRYSFHNIVLTLKGASGIVLPGSPVDRAQRENLELALQNMQKGAKARETIREQRLEFVAELDAYYKVYYTYFDEWNQFCRLRDDVYFNMAEGRWVAAIDAADRALKVSPTDSETLLLKARAILESSRNNENGKAQRVVVRQIVDRVRARTPDLQAPCDLLEAVALAQDGEREAARQRLSSARIAYEKLAMLYPQYAELYELRGYLRNSPEGVRVLQSFRGIYLGSGYFSPNLQAVDLGLAEGKEREELLKHFRGRIATDQRNQAEMVEVKQALTKTAERVADEAGWWKRFTDSSAVEKDVTKAQLPDQERLRELQTLSILDMLKSDADFALRRFGESVVARDREWGYLLYRPAGDGAGSGGGASHLVHGKDRAEGETVSAPGNETRVMLAFRSVSAPDLSNVSIVALVQYTDMQTGDYAYIRLPRSAATLTAGKTTRLESADFAYVHAGQKKFIDDIVRCTALVISDQGIDLVLGIDSRKENKRGAATPAVPEKPGSTATAPK